MATNHHTNETRSLFFITVTSQTISVNSKYIINHCCIAWLQIFVKAT